MRRFYLRTKIKGEYHAYTADGPKPIWNAATRLSADGSSEMISGKLPDKTLGYSTRDLAAQVRHQLMMDEECAQTWEICEVPNDEWVQAVEAPSATSVPMLVNVRLIGKSEAVAALAESLRLIANVQKDSGNRTGRKSADDRLRYIAVIVQVPNEDIDE